MRPYSQVIQTETSCASCPIRSTTLYNVCSVHRGMFSTSRVFSTSGGYHEYIGGISWVHRRISLVHRGMFSTLGGIHDECGDIMMNAGRYHEYIGEISWVLWGISWVHRGCSVHQRDIMIHVEEQLNKILLISIENSDVLSIPRCTHDIRPMYWTSRDVLMVSPHMYHEIPLMYWTSANVLMISPRCTHGIPDVLMVSPMYSWYPPHVSWYPPMYSGYPSDVLNIPPMYSWYPSDVLNTPPIYSWYPPNALIVSPWCTHGTPPPMYRTPDVLNTHYTGCQLAVN